MPAKLRRTVGPVYGFIAAIAFAAVLMLPGAASAVVSQSACPPDVCAASDETAQTLESAIQLALSLNGRNRSYKKFKLKQCCRRWKRGESLKGAYCSPKYLDYAIRQGICPQPYPGSYGY